jgi:hypothetical protein
MTNNIMTAAVLTALAVTVAVMAATPFISAEAIGNATHAAGSESAPLTVNRSAADRQLTGYHDPHARKRNIATQTVDSCWVRTRYGTVNVCETDGRAE